MAVDPIAEELADELKEISVAEFFEKNKQILGFDSTTRAVITSVKEGVDNALDACEEAGVLPEIHVEVEKLDKSTVEITIEDNGPGIVKDEIPTVFGQMLYGSRFHAIEQSRGQQGIGISAVVLYSQLTTGKPAEIVSKIGEGEPAHYLELSLDTKRNEPEIVREEIQHWEEKDHGTKLKVRLEGRYIRGQQSVEEYLRETAMVNPHARITFVDAYGDEFVFERATDELPDETEEIKPHPQGIELGTLLKMARVTDAYKLSSFLKSDFESVGSRTLDSVCNDAGVPRDVRPQDLSRGQARRLLDAFEDASIRSPPTDCLAPIGEDLIRKGLEKENPDADFVATATRPAEVASGHPFQVEAGIVFGGDLPEDEEIQINRYANRVPLMYRQGGCVITHAIEGIDWRNYNLDQRGGQGIPVGAAEVVVHVASTNVPFTSEAKEAIADIPGIEKEIELAVRECARKMRTHIKKQEKLEKMREKEDTIRKLLPKIAEKSASVLGEAEPPIEPVIAKIMNSVMVNQDRDYVKTRDAYKIDLEITNYTQAGKDFDLYVAVPGVEGIEVAEDEPEAERVEGALKWDLDKLAMGEGAEIHFEFQNLDRDDLDRVDVYVDGLSEEVVIGAGLWSDVDPSELQPERVAAEA